MTAPTGWICPSCGTALAPWVVSHCVKSTPSTGANSGSWHCGVCNQLVLAGQPHECHGRYTCEHGITLTLADDAGLTLH